MDMRQIRQLMQAFDESGLSKLKIAKEGFALEMDKAAASVPSVAAVPVAAAPAEVSTPTTPLAGDEILSPMVGTFYAAPSPDSDPFVKPGDRVNKGQTLAVLEAMKIMNELEAEYDCKIIDILVTDGQAVEYDMPLFIVKKL